MRHSGERDVAVNYLKKRGLSGEIAKAFRLGYAPSGWRNLLDVLLAAGVSEEQAERAGLAIKRERGGYYDRFRERVMFPIHDRRGRVIGFGDEVTGALHRGRELADPLTENPTACPCGGLTDDERIGGWRHETTLLWRRMESCQRLPEAIQPLGCDAASRQLTLQSRPMSHSPSTAVWSLTTKKQLRDARGKVVGTLGMTRVVDADVVHAGGEDAALGLVLVHMRKHFAEPLSNVALARIAGRSVRAFERMFRRQMQATPQQFLRRLRLRLACRELTMTRRPLAAIAAGQGFCDQSHFVREFRREFGVTPGDYRNRQGASSSPR